MVIIFPSFSFQIHHSFYIYWTLFLFVRSFKTNFCCLRCYWKNALPLECSNFVRLYSLKETDLSSQITTTEGHCKARDGIVCQTHFIIFWLFMTSELCILLLLVSALWPFVGLFIIYCKKLFFSGEDWVILWSTQWWWVIRNQFNAVPI